jgi:hypothetical protein
MDGSLAPPFKKDSLLLLLLLLVLSVWSSTTGRSMASYSILDKMRPSFRCPNVSCRYD